MSPEEMKKSEILYNADNVTCEKMSTSLLELVYLTRAKNNKEISFSEWFARSLEWAKAVIDEKEKKSGNERRQ